MTGITSQSRCNRPACAGHLLLVVRFLCRYMCGGAVHLCVSHDSKVSRHRERSSAYIVAICPGPWQRLLCHPEASSHLTSHSPISSLSPLSNPTSQLLRVDPIPSSAKRAIAKEHRFCLSPKAPFSPCLLVCQHTSPIRDTAPVSTAFSLRGAPLSSWT